MRTNSWSLFGKLIDFLRLEHKAMQCPLQWWKKQQQQKMCVWWQWRELAGCSVALYSIKPTVYVLYMTLVFSAVSVIWLVCQQDGSHFCCFVYFYANPDKRTFAEVFLAVSFYIFIYFSRNLDLDEKNQRKSEPLVTLVKVKLTITVVPVYIWYERRNM